MEIIEIYIVTDVLDYLVTFFLQRVDNIFRGKIEPALREQQCSLYLAVPPSSPPPSYVRMRTTVRHPVVGTNCALHSASDVVFDCCAHAHIGGEGGGRWSCRIGFEKHLLSSVKALIRFEKHLLSSVKALVNHFK
uniref:(California timema) hypothetical protein n=1 Tax=Timema californicum TaxID=61474 RepID=A0A7R9P8K2_TIMCA|nr:unnamed protein product [Timema californicum]